MAAQDMRKGMVGIVAAGLALSCGRVPIEPSSLPIAPASCEAETVITGSVSSFT